MMKGRTIWRRKVKVSEEGWYELLIEVDGEDEGAETEDDLDIIES